MIITVTNAQIKRLRKELKLSQTEFGKRLGVTGTAISRIENGDRSVTEQMALLICKEFNVNYFWLTEDKGDTFIVVDDASQLVTYAAELSNAEYDGTEQQKIASVLLKLITEDWNLIEPLVKAFTTYYKG